MLVELPWLNNVVLRNARTMLCCQRRTMLPAAKRERCYAANRGQCCAANREQCCAAKCEQCCAANVNNVVLPTVDNACCEHYCQNNAMQSWGSIFLLFILNGFPLHFDKKKSCAPDILRLVEIQLFLI